MPGINSASTRSPPSTNKEWYGKRDVFDADLHKELFDAHCFYDAAEMLRRLATHLHWYNDQRTSHALGGLLVPADRSHGRADDVLARIEAGAGGEGLDALVLSDRCLELFKVVSHGGRPEVWLRSISEANWPKLERLSLQLGPESNVKLKDIRPLLEGPGLPSLGHLGITNAEFTEELSKELPGARILPQREELDLCMGTLSERTASRAAEVRWTTATCL